MSDLPSSAPATARWPLPGRWLPGLALGALACGLAAGYLAAERSLPTALLPLDDSYIHLQFARQLASGHGLAYQGDDLVPGSTAPLWSALLSLVFLLPIDKVVGAKLLGVACSVLAGIAVWRLATRVVTGRPLAVFAAVAYLLTDWATWSALSGMEICLFVALLCTGLAWHIDERRSPRQPPRSLVVLALAALARPEAVLLLGAAALDRLLLARRAGGATGAGRSRPGLRPLLCGLGLGLVLLLPSVVVALVATDGALPTTWSAKTHGAATFVPRLRTLFTAVEIVFRPLPWLTLLALGGCARLLARLGTARDAGAALPLFALALPLAFSMLSGDGPPVVGNFGRYFFPLLALVSVLGVVALEPASARLRRVVPQRARWIVFTSCALLLLWPTLRAHQVGRQRYLLNLHNVLESDVAAARWLARHVPPSATVGVQDIGAIKYLAPQRVLDLVGIVSPEILPYTRGRPV